MLAIPENRHNMARQYHLTNCISLKRRFDVNARTAGGKRIITMKTISGFS
jgi:hypothetical protein